MVQIKVNRWRIFPRGVTSPELWDFPVGSGVFAQKVGALRVAELRQRGRTEPEVAELLAADLLEVTGRLHRLQPGTDLQKARSLAGFDLLFDWRSHRARRFS